MEKECRVPMAEESERREEEKKFVLCTKANLGLLACTLLLVGCAAAVLLTANQGLSQKDEHLGALKLSMRQTHVRAAIHLDGKYDDETGTVRWQKDTDQSYSQGELTLDNNEIVIPLSGPYFVYSQASYRLTCSSEEEDGEEEEEEESGGLVHISHTVERKSDSVGSGEEPEEDYNSILHSVRTACHRHRHKGHWFTGVYVGAMFNLKRGDRLRVNLTENPNIRSNLDDDNGETFFGVFAL
uniref:Tumor necrosis factor alpha n=2 Tax=Boleophthalmus pectinirostris TaxID=150288 RepID=A0A1W6LRX6_BOLPE|nr:tumor necrosis factor alpha [Boleophthalmus pectinirostris]